MINSKRKPKKKEELYKCLSCKGCTKKCLSNARIATKEVALRCNAVMSCNNATQFSIIEETLIPTKNTRR